MPVLERVSWWNGLELAALAVGCVGTAAACLASYDWHWFRESRFYALWSVAPYGLLALGSWSARKLVTSQLLRPITAVLAVAISALSLTAYIGAVRHPNHSSGMVFAVLPLLWMTAIPVFYAGVIVAFVAVARWRRPDSHGPALPPSPGEG